jgi:hypothetical protein
MAMSDNDPMMESKHHSIQRYAVDPEDLYDDHSLAEEYSTLIKVVKYADHVAEVNELKARVSDARSQVNDLKARLIVANEALAAAKRGKS